MIERFFKEMVKVLGILILGTAGIYLFLFLLRELVTEFL